eukprot:s4_g54.t1
MAVFASQRATTREEAESSFEAMQLKGEMATSFRPPKTYGQSASIDETDVNTVTSGTSFAEGLVHYSNLGTLLKAMEGTSDAYQPGALRSRSERRLSLTHGFPFLEGNSPVVNFFIILGTLLLLTLIWEGVFLRSTILVWKRVGSFSAKVVNNIKVPSDA